MRVTPGACAGVVATTPRSENSAVLRAPASSIASRSRRSETPVALRASTVRPPWLKWRTSAQAAAVLPELMQEPTSATTGTGGSPVASGAAGSSAGLAAPAAPPMRAATPIRSPR